MTVFGWVVTGFAVFMACVSLFAFVQIERHGHQRRQQQATVRSGQRAK